MKAKTVKETLNEAGGAGGAGYAVWGGGWGRSFGNPSMGKGFGGRGFGFGGSYNNSGGPNLMYTYNVVPLNQTLEPRPSDPLSREYIHIGSVIKGRILGTNDHIIGQVLRIEEDDDGNIKYYLVLSEESQKLKIDPTSAFLFEPEEDLDKFDDNNIIDHDDDDFNDNELD